ncbi:hypothetical protein QFW80_12080 [Luteimonas sp. M1R5S18]|uniref:Uncharacterized protein n=1 Tax=Luteimonas rhizosphaericola TaxID=3042024 RepID=A0ABT6JL42_9GAMM|nr:hypothetical protein [Luteimonas rhizosphaericola]MDH5831252.1 hypothetical protein [Luteimonas rhizosphaericola]
MLALVQNTSATLGLDKYPTLANALIFASAAVAGSLLEGIGTNFEVAWDKEREEQYSVTSNWHDYLFRSFDKEPVGYRYLSRLVTTLYFELTMMFAVPSFFLGAGLLAALRFPSVFIPIVIVAVAAMVGSGLYLHKQAKCTHKVICETRMELNRRATAS